MAKASSKKSHPRPIVLMVIEGWGIAPEGEGNAIASAATPFFDSLISGYPTGTLRASGDAVGLSTGIVPSSQTGHYCIGHGAPWIDTAQIISERFDQNQLATENGFSALQNAIDSGKKRIHLMGLVSNVEQESCARHIKGLIDFLSSYPELEVFIHCILDGRESSATAGQRLVQEIEEMAKVHPNAHVVSLIGRMYGLDAKNNISRTQKAKALLREGEANFAESVEEACSEAYEKKIFDEEFSPTIIGKAGDRSGLIADSDIVIAWNHSGQSFSHLIEALITDMKKPVIFTLTDYEIALTQPLFSISVEAKSVGPQTGRPGFWPGAAA
jgi:2,3-bisphosphoglycerate-independent phosphoglycerate mutase